jgi:16S rRNA (adenine1518-N6/adenine1519-N6)-dimethyltransferase
MIQPKKHLGQHFLHDENIARKITGFVPPNTRNLLEVGPGMGVLTKYLIQEKCKNYLAVEVDRDAIEYLKVQFPGHTDKFILGDFLKMDLENLFSESFSVIGNFPYNISGRILFRIIENRNKITEVIGMFQKEVAERISSLPGNKKYGIPSVLVQAFFNIDYLFTVNENVFFPPPKVKSAVIRLTRNKTDKLDCDESLFFAIVKSGFNQRRKTLRNSLKSFTFQDLEKISELLNLRAEQLSVVDFIVLAQNVIARQGERN